MNAFTLELVRQAQEELTAEKAAVELRHTKQDVDGGLLYKLHPNETVYTAAEVAEAKEWCVEVVKTVDAVLAAELELLEGKELYQALFEWTR